MIKYSIYIILLFSIILAYSCSDPVTGKVENLPPDTYLSIFPDSTIAPGSTVKTIRWWGDDPDGYVSGFRISFDSVNWGYTTKNDSTFILSINGSDSTFRFFVASVDDKGLIDNTPATNLYPVINTPPLVSFDAGTELPETTLTVASFKWTGSDPDGEENIKYYQWSLNDTLNFRRVSGLTNLLTLTKDSGLAVNANNVFYLRAEDEAGALSPIVRMPDTAHIWHVRNNTSRILMLRDIPVANISTATAYFANAFDTIHYDVLDIKSNNGALIPKIVNPMFVQTLNLYDMVIWTGGIGSVGNAANFGLAQQALPFYIQSGGKVFFTSGFTGPGSLGQGSIVNFAPIDSVTSCTIPIYGTNDANLTLIENTYPVIGSSTGIFFVRGVYTTTGVKIYNFYNGLGCFDTICVGMKDVQTNPKVIYLALPVYFLDRNPVNSKALFRKIFIEEFGY